MILHCPACGKQHVAAPETHEVMTAGGIAEMPDWTNPPHRSHLCHGCGHIWRPADVPTNGVRFIRTHGEADSAPVPPAPVVAASDAQSNVIEMLLTVGNMHDITYANPDKLNIRAHAAKKARLTHKFVMFYTYNGMHKVMTAGSLEAIAGYIEMRIKSHADMLAIIGD